jgi:hypothetical protein
MPMHRAGRLLVIGASIGCAAAPTDGGAASLAIPRAIQLAGCYQVQVGAWESTGQDKGLVPPAEFRLDTVASSSMFASYETRRSHPERVRLALPEVGGRRTFPGMWYPVGPDSLRIQWNTGFTMGGYRLAVRGDSVEGIATTWVDYRQGPPDPTAPVRGRRVACGG